MNRDIVEFIRLYTSAIEKSTAAIFAGAGLSKPAGFVNWKELMRDIAEEIHLDIEKETDLIAVAQYHVNESGGNRGKINQVLIDEFTKDTDTTENHKILARLPIRTYWTTNYDKLIEESLKNEKKRVDVKITQESLAVTTANSEATIYKMHGDIALPHEAVLTKDDYESYNTKRQLFTTALQGDLVSKTFLFVGFSFDDPNLEYILSRIRVLLGNNQRPHYCFMKKVQLSDFQCEKDFLYAEIKQELKVNDLKRFNIKVLLVENYNFITEVLKSIEENFRRRNIFISASAVEYGTWGEQRSLEFARLLSRSIIKNGNNIVTGFGLGIGSCVISGALEEIYTTNTHKIEERLLARPFPQITMGTMSIKEIWTRYRNEMIENVGISIFMFGNKVDVISGKTVEANGMVEEFEISASRGVVPIPIGVTGYATYRLWEMVMIDFNNFVPDTSLEQQYRMIAEEGHSDQEIVDAVIQIINKLEKRGGK